MLAGSKIHQSQYQYQNDKEKTFWIRWKATPTFEMGWCSGGLLMISVGGNCAFFDYIQANVNSLITTISAAASTPMLLAPRSAPHQGWIVDGWMVIAAGCVASTLAKTADRSKQVEPMTRVLVIVKSTVFIQQVVVNAEAVSDSWKFNENQQRNCFKLFGWYGSILIMCHWSSINTWSVKISNE